MIKYNSNTISKWYDGTSNVKKAYHGNKLMFLEYLAPSYKLVAQHSDLTEYKVACNGSSVLSSAETKADSASASTRNVTIGDCVTELGAYSFNSFANLTGVTLPSGLTTIGERCFDSSHGITSITLPNSVVTINDSAFRHMHGLKQLNIPSGVTTIPNMCFNDCTALSSFTIPSNITAISGTAFSYCTALKEVHFQGTTPPTIAANVFNGSTNLEKIYIPSCTYYDVYAAALPNHTSLIYAEDETSCSQTLQWVTFSNGDTIPSDLQIYGIKGIVNDLSNPFSDYTDNIYVENAGRNKYNIIFGGYNSPCYNEDDIASNTSVEYTFSNIGCSDYYTVSSKTIADMSNDIQLLIYA